MNSNYLKHKHKHSLLELLQKQDKMFDGTLGKYTGPNYTIALKKNAKPFPIPKFDEPPPKKNQQINYNRIIKEN